MTTNKHLLKFITGGLTLSLCLSMTLTLSISPGIFAREGTETKQGTGAKALSYGGKKLPIETLCGLLDADIYRCLSYTRVPLRLPPPEAQNKHMDLGLFDLYGTELLSVLEMPPQLYEQFTGRLVNDAVSAAGVLQGKSCQTTIAMFDKPLPAPGKIMGAIKGDTDISSGTADKSILKWHRGSSDWYLTVLGERIMVIGTDLQIVKDAIANYRDSKINTPSILSDLSPLLSTIAPHAQIDGSKSDLPPLLLQMDTNNMLTLSMPDTGRVKPTKDMWQKVLTLFERDTDVKLSQMASDFKLTVPGDKPELLKVQKCLMVECSPAVVHNFKTWQ